MTTKHQTNKHHLPPRQLGTYVAERVHRVMVAASVGFVEDDTPDYTVDESGQVRTEIAGITVQFSPHATTHDALIAFGRAMEQARWHTPENPAIQALFDQHLLLITDPAIFSNTAYTHTLANAGEHETHDCIAKAQIYAQERNRDGYQHTLISVKQPLQVDVILSLGHFEPGLNATAEDLWLQMGMRDERARFVRANSVEFKAALAESTRLSQEIGAHTQAILAALLPAAIQHDLPNLAKVSASHKAIEGPLQAALALEERYAISTLQAYTLDAPRNPSVVIDLREHAAAPQIDSVQHVSAQHRPHAAALTGK